MFRDGNIINNMFSRIQMENIGAYHLLKLDGLEVGEYILTTKFCANEIETIKITVHKGTYWQEIFLLKKNQMFQSSAQKNMIRINGVTH